MSVLKTTRHVCLMVTCPSFSSAKTLGKKIVKMNFAACVQIVPKVTSIFIWKNKTQNIQENLLLIKTIRSKIPHIEKMMLKLHPYDTPEFLLFPFTGGSKKFLSWMNEALS